MHNKEGIAEWSRGLESGSNSNLEGAEGTWGFEGTGGSGF